MLAQIPATFCIPPAAPLPSTAGDLPRREGKHALRALVVDAEPLVRWAIAETLHADGYEVEQAGDADGAVHALVESAAPDVVLLDLRLPDCSDLSLLETVRRLVPEATVILMTAFGTPDVRQAARNLGAADVLDKPFDVDGLAGLVTTLRPSH
jgi:DNA-binding NtrC family response regulator